MASGLNFLRSPGSTHAGQGAGFSEILVREQQCAVAEEQERHVGPPLTLDGRQAAACSLRADGAHVETGSEVQLDPYETVGPEAGAGKQFADALMARHRHAKDRDTAYLFVGADSGWAGRTPYPLGNTDASELWWLYREGTNPTLVVDGLH